MRAVRFIGLKILELSGLALFIFGLYHLGNWWGALQYPDLYALRGDSFWWVLMQGVGALMLAIMCIIVPTTIVIGLYYLIKKNWEWAGK